MTPGHPSLDRPIRVVVFGSGPILTHDARRFLCLLEAHPEIELMAAFCQAESQTFTAVVRDLWRRRGILAAPLLAASIFKDIARYIRKPRQEIALRHALERIAARIHFVTDIHSSQVAEQIRSLAPDLGLIYGSPILKPALFNLPAMGTLGIHHGKAPQYRGNKTTFWAMYNGEQVAGVMIQKINTGLDTGSVVKTGEVVIGRRSLGSVQHELEEVGLAIYIQAILEVKHGTATYRPQEGPRGKLYKNPTLSDLVKFWVRQARRRIN